MKGTSFVSLLFAMVAMVLILGGSPGWAESVVIIPLGSQEGEFCVGDRALLFEDPTGVRVLIAPGRTVRGSRDPRLGGRVDVLLIDHPHTDHLGNVLDTNCSGSTTAPFEFPAQGNAPEIAARLNSAVVVGGEMGSYFTQKILNVRGTAPPGCPAEGFDNAFTVPRTAPCVGGIRGGTRMAVAAGESEGVKFTTIPAFHGAGAPPALVDPPGVAPGLTAYAGTETGFIIRFTNGLTVLWTGDSGLLGDWATQSEMYGVNLAVIHADGSFSMGQEEGAFAVLNLIKPRTVIPEHMNQVSTAGGAVVAGTRVERLMQLLRAPARQFPPSRPPKVIVPLSGVPIFCSGSGNCTQQ